MKIERINVTGEGYVHCRSCFYSSQDILPTDFKGGFSVGVNKLRGEIDSGVWATSYLLSMYNFMPKDFVLSKRPEITINNVIVPLEHLSEYSCYMDRSYPLFSTNVPVRKIVSKGIQDNKLNYSPDEIKILFNITTERFDRPLSAIGNEVFKAMAAIGVCFEKQVFCFPWLSQKRFESYHNNLLYLLDTLSSLKKIIILPIGGYSD